MSISTRINNLKRITSKTVLIKKYLDILDEEYSYEILYELFQLYSCSNKKFMAYSFADMVKYKYLKAYEYIIDVNEVGNITPPLVTRTYNNINNTNNTIVTVSNSSYFSVLLNCLASIYKNTIDSVSSILVYNIGLKLHQVEFLNSLKYVTVIPNNFKFPFYEWKFDVSSDALNHTNQFLYLDAGCFVNKDLTPLFDYISENKYLLFNHYVDDINQLSKWTTKEVYDTFSINKSKCSKQTSISTLMGFSQDSKYIIDEVLKYNTNYLLRPHSSCIDNRYDQSLSAIIFKYILDLKFLKFEDYLNDLHNNGNNNPYITIHYSKMKMEHIYNYLIRK